MILRYTCVSTDGLGGVSSFLGPAAILRAGDIYSETTWWVSPLKSFLLKVGRGKNRPKANWSWSQYSGQDFVYLHLTTHIMISQKHRFRGKSACCEIQMTEETERKRLLSIKRGHNISLVLASAWFDTPLITCSVIMKMWAATWLRHIHRSGSQIPTTVSTVKKGITSPSRGSCQHRSCTHTERCSPT